MAILMAVVLLGVSPARSSASVLIDLVEVEQSVKVTCAGSQLIVTGAAGKTLRVYNLIGVEVMSVKIDNSEKTVDLSHLPKGVYPVKVGNVTKKVNLPGK